MPDYSRVDLINAFRTQNPDAANIPDNKIFAAIAVADPELAKGISELKAPAGQDRSFTNPEVMGPLLGGVGPTAFGEHIAGYIANAVNALMPGASRQNKNIKLPELTPEQEVGAKVGVVGPLVETGLGLTSKLASTIAPHLVNPEDAAKLSANLKNRAVANRAAAAEAPSVADALTNIDVTRPASIVRQPLKILNTATQPLRASIQEAIANKIAGGMPVTQAEIAADEAARLASTQGAARVPLPERTPSTETFPYPGPPKIATAQLAESAAQETPQQLFERVKAQRNAELPASQLGETAKGGFERPAPQPIPVIEPGETKLTPEAVNKWMGTRVEDVTHGGNPGKRILDEGLLAQDVPEDEMRAATKANVDTSLENVGKELDARLKTADAKGGTVDAQTPIADAYAKIRERFGVKQDQSELAQTSVVDKIEAKYPDLSRLKPSDAHRLKVELGDSIDWKTKESTPVNDMMKEIYRKVNDAIAATDETMKPALRRWGDLYIASKNLRTAVAKQLIGSPSKPLEFGIKQ